MENTFNVFLCPSLKAHTESQKMNLKVTFVNITNVFST